MKTISKFRKHFASVLCLTILFTTSGATLTGQAPPPFDFDNGNALFEVFGPRVAPVLLTYVSPPAGSDASLILRITTVIANAWFDAIAPYHPTAVGVYSKLGRRPPNERTQRNRNIALLYASYRILNSLLPQHKSEWREMLTSVGLNPDDNQQNNASPIGIGNKAGLAVAAFRERDGMNQLGDEGGCQFNCQPYADYTGYKPKNTPELLLSPSNWQPGILTNGYGIFTAQQFVTPQYGRTKPYSYNDPNEFRSPFPAASQIQNFAQYQRQADEIIQQSAVMTDEQKMTAELFDGKLHSLGVSTGFIAAVNGLSMEEFVILDFVVQAAVFDTGIAVWNDKYVYDAVRPFSAIHYLYGDQDITAWGGPGKGTVRMKGREWKSYLPTANHPEYPSGSASFCSAHAQAMRRYFNSDSLGWPVLFLRGSSRIEPGVSPANDLTLSFPTWTDFEQRCGLSRFWSGVHFKSSLTAGHAIGKAIGDRAFTFVMKHVNGTP